jgi:hypothetical protein
VKELTIGRLKEILKAAEIQGELEDFHKVYICQNSVAFEAEVSLSCLAKAPQGGECVWYGLVFSIPGQAKGKTK